MLDPSKSVLATRETDAKFKAKEGRLNAALKRFARDRGFSEETITTEWVKFADKRIPITGER